MKIFVLTENNAGPVTGAEHGLSYLVEHDNKRILFDTGQSDLFMKNSAIMNIRLDNIDMIVLSHGHFDHGNGLEYPDGGSLVCHPGCFVKRYRKPDRSYIGLKMTRGEMESRFRIFLTKTHLPISENIFFLGEIPRVTTFESQKTSFELEDGTPDFVIDDSGMAVVLPSGLFIITGCGHAGIVNTVEHAIKITGAERVAGIMGGFHLKENDMQTQETVKYLLRKEVKHILPSHCTSGSALDEFRNRFGSAAVRSGDIYEF